MKKFILLMAVLFAAVRSEAHRVDNAVLLLVQEDSLWTLQLRSSLEAFRAEVRTHFADSPYSTPEEFKEQLLEHLKNTLRISVNDEPDLVLGDGHVKLGHETIVLYDNIKLPNDIASIEVINDTFNDIYNSRTSLFISKDGFKKERFLLSKTNQHALTVMLKNNHFVAATPPSEANFFSPTAHLMLGLLLVSVMAFTIWFFKKRIGVGA